MATKHISLLSARDETCDNQIDLVDENYNRNHHMNSRINLPTNHFNEQRLKSTLVASAEKVKYVFYRNAKAVRKLKYFYFLNNLIIV